MTIINNQVSDQIRKQVRIHVWNRFKELPND